MPDLRPPPMMDLAHKSRKVPGLRYWVPPSDCYVYKIENGKKVFVRIEKAK